MTDSEPVHVVTGFGWTAAGAWVTALTALVGLVTLIVKSVGPWKKQTTDAETKMREELSARVDSLTTQVDALRNELVSHHAHCEKIISEIRAQHALEIDMVRKQHLIELARALGKLAQDEA